MAEHGGAGAPPKHAHNTVVYREPGRYAGWPANYGIWSWGDEIVVGFIVGTLDPDLEGHKRDKRRPFTTMQARSLDGGETWEVVPMSCRTPGGKALSANEHQVPDLQIGPELAQSGTFEVCNGGINFTHPGFAVLCARTGLGAGAVSWFYLSTDRCRHWAGPFRLPDFGQPGIAARTDVLVSGPSEALFFLTAAKTNGGEGRIFCARTEDGGQTFDFVAWVGREPQGYSIMPSSVRLPSQRILMAIRRRAGSQDPAARCWIELYRSDDDGTTWTAAGEPVPDTGRGGNPPAMVRLRDGRLCLTYGYRAAPFGVRAVLSEDEGRTWHSPLVLRDDGGDGDLGYTRTVQRADGRLVTVYYYNEDPHGERFIGATIWDADRQA